MRDKVKGETKGVSWEPEHDGRELEINTMSAEHQVRSALDGA